MSEIDDLIARQRDEYTCADDLHTALADALEFEHAARRTAEAERDELADTVRDLNSALLNAAASSTGGDSDDGR